MRWVVGFLLVGAGVLKAVQLVAEPATALTSPLGSFFAPLQIAAELSIGLFALLNLYWRQLRWLALVLFSGFAVYSFHLATSGAASCGCFGPIEVHPWWTFGLDAAIVVGLLLPQFARTASPRPTTMPQRQLAAALMAVVAVGTLALVWNVAPSSTASFTTVGNLVVLEPNEWIGKPLPIADFIDADLSEGEWVVLLHRHDCPECQEAAPQYEDLADAQNVALIEMPPYDGEPLDHGPALHARMPDDREWFVQTPVEIRIRDGVVLDASTELPAIVGATEL